MGIYVTPCRQCEKLFLWFSGHMDQRCQTCKTYAGIPGPQYRPEVMITQQSVKLPHGPYDELYWGGR